MDDEQHNYHVEYAPYLAQNAGRVSAANQQNQQRETQQTQEQQRLRPEDGYGGQAEHQHEFCSGVEAIQFEKAYHFAATSMVISVVV